MFHWEEILLLITYVPGIGKLLSLSCSIILQGCEKNWMCGHQFPDPSVDPWGWLWVLLFGCLQGPLWRGCCKMYYSCLGYLIVQESLGWRKSSPSCRGVSSFGQKDDWNIAFSGSNKRQSPPKAPCFWAPLHARFFKLNIDTSIKKDTGVASWGYVIKNCRGSPTLLRTKEWRDLLASLKLKQLLFNLVST